MRIFDACLNELTPFLCEPLVSPEKVELLKARARGLPDELAAFYLECRLSPPSPEVDVLALARRGPSADEGAAAEQLDGHEPNGARFFNRWLSGTIANACPTLWLELDDCPTGPMTPFANLHVGVSQAYGRRSGRTTAYTTTDTDRRTQLALLEQMTTASLLSPAQLTMLTQQLQDLPAEAQLIHVSTMTGRIPFETKIYVALPRGALADCIERVAGRPWLERLELLMPWSDEALNGDTLYCDLTFRASGCHSVGLVFSRHQATQTGSDPERERVRIRLIQEGLCTLAQDAALAAWTASPSSPVCGFDSSRRLDRWVDLKVTMTSSRLTSKAYLGFAPRVSLF